VLGLYLLDEKSLRWQWSRKVKQLAFNLGLGSCLLGLVLSAMQLPSIASGNGMAFPSARSLFLSQTPTIPNGVYLFGESPEPDTIGAAYAVFEVRQNQAVGAFYMPHSSFDCFYGSLNSQQLAVTIVNSYDRTSHAYAIGLSDYPVASGGEIVGNLELEGFHRIEETSEGDREILATCQDLYQDRVWN